MSLCVYVCVYVHIYFIYTLSKEIMLFLNEQLKVVCYCYDDDQEATKEASSAENFNHQKQRGEGRKVENRVRWREQ